MTDHHSENADIGVAVSDHEAVRDHLTAWCEGGGGEVRVEVVDGVERVVCDFGRATFAVTAEERVDASMPLHGFDGRADRLVFEGEPAQADAVHVLGPDVSYVYRRP